MFPQEPSATHYCSVMVVNYQFDKGFDAVLNQWSLNFSDGVVFYSMDIH